MSRSVRDPSASLPEWFRNKRTARPLIVARWVPVALVGLPVAVLLAIVIYPTIWMFYHSLRDTNIQGLFMGSHEYIGFQNYAAVVGSDRFQQSLGHLVQYLTFGACLQVLIGTVLALTLYEFVRSNSLRTIILIILAILAAVGGGLAYVRYYRARQLEA